MSLEPEEAREKWMGVLQTMDAVEKRPLTGWMFLLQKAGREPWPEPGARFDGFRFDGVSRGVWNMRVI